MDYKNLKKLVFFSNTFLFSWYIFSCFLLFFDKTLTSTYFVLMEIVNLSMLYLIGLKIKKKDSYNKIQTIINFFLICWFIYFTPIDYLNKGYSLVEHYVYILIDLSSILFLVDNFIYKGLLFLDNKKIIKKHLFNTSYLIIFFYLISRFFFKCFK